MALRQGDPARAETLLRQALEWNPKSAQTWVHLSRARLAVADTLGAISVLHEGTQRAPDSPVVEAALGRTYYLWGGYEQGVLHLERAVKAEPGREEWQGWLREARVATGEVLPEKAAPDSAALSGNKAAEPSFEVPEPASPPRVIPVAPLTHEPTAEELSRLETRAQKARRSPALRRADFAVLLAAYGPVIRPWPSPRDLPPDAVDHPDAPYLAVALLGSWLRPDLTGLVHPDSLLTRAEAALLLEPQVRRYPALRRGNREVGSLPDVPEENRAHYAITVAVAAADDLLNARVPSFVLQPLVENAIRHGVAPRASGGRVSVSATRTGSALNLKVEDDGVGLLAGWRFPRDANYIGAPGRPGPWRPGDALEALRRYSVGSS